VVTTEIKIKLFLYNVLLGNRYTPVLKDREANQKYLNTITLKGSFVSLTVTVSKQQDLRHASWLPELSSKDMCPPQLRMIFHLYLVFHCSQNFETKHLQNLERHTHKTYFPEADKNREYS
jgi:hypothetical protein